MTYKQKLILPVYLIGSLIFCNISKSKAQESIIPDISYLFLEKLIATAKQNYPRIKQYEITNQIAELRLKNEKLNWFDHFSFFYFTQPNNTVNLTNPGSSFFSGYQFGINLNVASLLQKPNNIKVSKLELAGNQNEAKEYAITLEAEVKRRYFTYVQQLNNVKLFTKTLQDADGLLKDLKMRYERGEVTFDIYSQGLISFSNTNKSKIESEAAFLMAKSAIEELTITRIEDIK